MGKAQIAIEIDSDTLRRYSDGFLATAWHVAQANPAPSGDHAAGELVEQIGREIIRRWLSGVEPELWNHQGRSYYHRQLTQFAKYTPPAGVDAFSPEWHRGEWTLKPEAIQAATEAAE